MVPAASPPCGFVHAHPASHSPGGSGSWPLSSSWAWPATFPCGPWPVDALPPSLPAGSLGVVLCALGSTSLPLMRMQTSAQATLSSRASSEPISSAVSSDRPASGSPQCLGVRTSAFAFRRHTVHPVRGRSDSTWVRMLRREALSLRVVLLAHSQWPGSVALSLPRDPRGRPPCTAHPGSQREGGAGDRGGEHPPLPSWGRGSGGRSVPCGPSWGGPEPDAAPPRSAGHSPHTPGHTAPSLAPQSPAGQPSLSRQHLIGSAPHVPVLRLAQMARARRCQPLEWMRVSALPGNPPRAPRAAAGGGAWWPCISRSALMTARPVAARACRRRKLPFENRTPKPGTKHGRPPTPVRTHSSLRLP